jgi:predicted RNA-binding Zn-ribbon protein involved in translation (DUF1610 family)
MGLDDLILNYFGRNPRFLRSVDNIAKWAFLGALGLLFFHYNNVLQLANVPYLVLALWIYLFFNGVVATSFNYVDSKRQLALDKPCPQCGTILKRDVGYTCPNCGKITFKKE